LVHVLAVIGNGSNFDSRSAGRCNPTAFIKIAAEGRGIAERRIRRAQSSRGDGKAIL
jgi:hypothetical protein